MRPESDAGSDSQAQWASVSCDGLRRDREGRLIAVCRTGEENPNAWLVAEGWPLAYRSQSMAYVSAEEAAREAASGLWAGAFEPPWVWRQVTRSPNGWHPEIDARFARLPPWDTQNRERFSLPIACRPRQWAVQAHLSSSITRLGYGPF